VKNEKELKYGVIGVRNTLCAALTLTVTGLQDTVKIEAIGELLF